MISGARGRAAPDAGRWKMKIGRRIDKGMKYSFTSSTAYLTRYAVVNLTAHLNEMNLIQPEIPKRYTTLEVLK